MTGETHCVHHHHTPEIDPMGLPHNLGSRSPIAPVKLWWVDASFRCSCAKCFFAPSCSEIKSIDFPSQRQLQTRFTRYEELFFFGCLIPFLQFSSNSDQYRYPFPVRHTPHDGDSQHFVVLSEESNEESSLRATRVQPSKKGAARLPRKRLQNRGG
jgi:hypothetical protein